MCMVVIKPFVWAHIYDSRVDVALYHFPNFILHLLFNRESRTNFYFQSNEGGRTVTSVIVWIDLVLLSFNEKLVL
jgi:hypothetical protein